MSAAVSFCGALLLVAQLPLVAAAKDPWIGKQVFFSEAARAKIGDQEIDGERIPFSATVDDVDGDWLVLGHAKVRKSDAMSAEQALEFYSRRVRQHPTQQKNWIRRGMLRFAQGDVDNAISDWTEAIQLAPNDPMSYFKRANAWHVKRQYDKAIRDLTAVIRLDPKSADAYRNRAISLRAKGDDDKAIQDFDESIRLSPDDAKAYQLRGDLRFHMRNDSGALEDYTEAIRLDPNDVETYQMRAVYWFAGGDHAKAVEDYTQAIRLAPGDASLHSSRALSRKALGDYGGAIQDYSDAIRLDPKNVLAHGGLAWLRATCADPKYRNGAEAVRAATTACQLTAWKKAGNVEMLAAAYAEAGDFPAAIKWQQKALELAEPKAGKTWLQARLDLYQAGKPYHEESPK